MIYIYDGGDDDCREWICINESMNVIDIIVPITSWSSSINIIISSSLLDPVSCSCCCSWSCWWDGWWGYINADGDNLGNGGGNKDGCCMDNCIIDEDEDDNDVEDWWLFW